jgi:protein-tyrosine phosphatase
MTNLGLVPLVNFGHIDKTIYRSAQPEYRYQYDWLRDTLKLDLIVNLRGEAPLADNGHDIIHVAYAVKDHKPPTDEQALEFMSMIKSQSEAKKNVLIHCEHGHGRTSTFSVLAKLALGQSYLQAIADEHNRFHYQFRHPAQEAWLRENFPKLITKLALTNQ